MTPPCFDIQQLLVPARYPWPVDDVRLIETHISWVLLAGDRVVKLKRPVELGFVDFRDPAARKRACENEVRLNRRLTDDIYLGVIPITAQGVDASGEPLEWATLMRRMPAERMLDVLLEQGTAPGDLAELLAERLIPFHSSLLPSSQPERRERTFAEDPSFPAISPSNVILNDVKDRSRAVQCEPLPSGNSAEAHEQVSGQARGEILRVAQNDIEGRGAAPEAGLRSTRDPSASLGTTGEVGTTVGCPDDPNVYLTVLTDNLDQVAAVGGDILSGGQLAMVSASMRGFITQKRALLEARLKEWLVEGHGDLRCEHICLDGERLQIYDCVEFEIGIRCADVASDLAFLQMDLRRLGAQPTADELLECYRAAGFELPQPVIDLYCAHRALVRAKVAVLERSGVDAERDRAFAFEAASYLDLASAFATPVSPLLVIVSGLSGSGKSTVAAAIGRITGGQTIASDRVRKELAGMEATESGAAEWHQGIYSDEWTDRTYDRLLELATAGLERDRAVIVDATFLDNAWRERFIAAARERGKRALVVDVILDDDIARARIERRARERNDPSDATLSIRERQQAQLRESPLFVPSWAMRVTIDTSTDGPASLDPLFAALRGAGMIGTLQREGSATHA